MNSVRSAMPSFSANSSAAARSRGSGKEPTTAKRTGSRASPTVANASTIFSVCFTAEAIPNVAMSGSPSVVVRGIASGEGKPNGITRIFQASAGLVSSRASWAAYCEWTRKSSDSASTSFAMKIP